ncbi:hypothetical protein [Cloacibacterium sp.]|uniref:hypothetical protein n=1 Tax=Cloacibacterium sp. TaxID=1913682 RepID=UPI0035AD8486
MKFRLLIFIFIFSISKIFATAQAPDKIIIDNKEYDLLNNPLENYFAKNPELDPIYGGKIKMFEKYKTEIIPIPFSTGNYRGYIATFKIENQILKLIDIEIQNIESEKREYISVFKELFGDKNVTLNYSGILVIPTGDFLESANFGYSYLFTEYRLITINNDKVLKSKELSKDEYLKFKFKQFTEYKKTNQYKAEVKEYYENWKSDKKIELSKKNTKGLTKKEISELKKDFENPPKIELAENFIFLTKNIDFIIIDY